MSATMRLKALLQKLWLQYCNDSPQAGQIYQLFCDQGEVVQNDHIALRTVDDPRVTIDQLARFFCELGYHQAGVYHFPIKKLVAQHYEHRDPNQPKIFISALKLNEFSDTLQRELTHCIDQINPARRDTSELLYSGVSWQPLRYSVYQRLLDESEYAAWFYAFGFRANHFTVFVNQMKQFNTIEKVNQFLKHHHYALNTAGGEIKGTPGDFLEQSSTLASRVTVSFAEGQHDIPNSYYEFARRYPDANGQLYHGFIVASADKIFESTHAKKHD